MEHHVGMSFVQAGTLAPAHYVKQIRGQRIIRCTQGVSHTQMNTALCACGLSWKVSSTTGRGYNQTGGYGSVMTLAVGDRGSGFVAGPVFCRPRDRHLHRGLEFLATATVDAAGHVIALQLAAGGSSGYSENDAIVIEQVSVQCFNTVLFQCSLV
jgi:hypothetical protein